MNAMKQKVYEVAESQAGHHEIGDSNSGPQVDLYLASVGLPPGNPWCAAYVFWCLQHAHVNVGFKSGYVPDVESWARSRQILYTQPQIMDFFLLQMVDQQGVYSGHIGFVTAVNADGTVATIEGNTHAADSGGNDTDGGGVHRRVRANGDCLFVRWVLVAKEGTP